MAEEFTEKIDAALAAWTVLDDLPAELNGFVLSKQRQESEGQYDFFRYDQTQEPLRTSCASRSVLYALPCHLLFTEIWKRSVWSFAVRSQT